MLSKCSITASGSVRETRFYFDPFLLER